MPGELNSVYDKSEHRHHRQFSINQENYVQQNGLLHPNLVLTQQPNYQSISIEDSTDSGSDDDDDLFINGSMSASVIIDEADYLNADDDIIINNYDDTNASSEYDYHRINPEPISNIFMHHPHFNNTNKEYQCAMNTFIQQTTNCLSMGNEIYSINIPMRTITVPIIDPENINKQTTITAAADNGSDIQAIGINAILYYKERNLIQRDKTVLLLYR